jgi:hypothetical protein
MTRPSTKSESLTPEILSQALRLHDEDRVPWDVVAQHFGVCRKTLRARLRAEGYSLDRKLESGGDPEAIQAKRNRAPMQGFNPISQHYLSIKL